jgi:hypothetical protein
MSRLKTIWTGALLGASMAAAGPYDAWTGNRTIRLNTGVTGANVAGAVTNFPVLIRLTPAEAAIFTAAKAGGADIRFTKSNDTILPYQIERWDATAQRAEIWVKMDTVKGNDSAQTIKMFWGNASATSLSNGRAVFDTAQGYVGVWHLGDSTGTAPRPNAITGRFKAAPVSFAPGYQPPSGLIGRAENLTGGSNADSTTFLAINEGTSTTQFKFTGGMFTYAAWIQPAELTNFARLVSLVAADAGDERLFMAFSGGNLVGRVWGTASHPTNSSTSPALGEWSHVAMTVNRGPALDTTRLYHNGVEVATSTHNPMNDVERNYVRIGKDYINVGSDQTYHGLIDEARLSHATRSADYIKLSHASQAFAQKFTNIGAGVATVPEAPVGLAVSRTNNGGITVSWTAGGNGGSSITGYTVTASPGAATCSATPPATTCTVTGLTVGTPYTFTVKATNAIGASAASAPSSSISPSVGITPYAFIKSLDAARPFTYRLSASEMATTDRMTLSVADAQGRTVWSRSVSPRRDQVAEITWNGRSSLGAAVSAGMYFVRVSLEAEGRSVDFVGKAIELAPAR